MLKLMKILIAVVSGAVILGSWSMYTTVSLRLQAEQDRLLTYARACVENKIYDKGVVAFTDAVKMGVGDSATILYELANVYKEADALPQYREVLQDLINEASAPADMTLDDLYEEAARYDLDSGSVGNALSLLREGIMETGALQLLDLYEANRYLLQDKNGAYDEAGVIIGGYGRVLLDGLWGYVDSKGNKLLSPEYDLASNFDQLAVVQQAGELFAINARGVRQATGDFTAEDIGFFDGASFAVKPYGGSGYVMAGRSGDQGIDITKSDKVYDYIGMVSDGIRAIQKDGKWALLDSRGAKDDISSDFIYDGIALDELGRCAVDGMVFLQEGLKYYSLTYDGVKGDQAYDEVEPFFEQGGLAAVARNGKWGFINNAGEVVIDFQYEDAGSSSMGLAPVKKDGLWGYISVQSQSMGREVIPPQYLNAKQFVDGCAPVEGENGWFYTVLVEYE